MMKRVFDDYNLDRRAGSRSDNGLKRPCGMSTFGREIDLADGAAGDTRRQPRRGYPGDELARRPPGSDRKGPTAVLNSYCKLDFTRCPNGATGAN